MARAKNEKRTKAVASSDLSGICVRDFDGRRRFSRQKDGVPAESFARFFCCQVLQEALVGKTCPGLGRARPMKREERRFNREGIRRYFSLTCREVPLRACLEGEDL